MPSARWTCPLAPPPGGPPNTTRYSPGAPPNTAGRAAKHNVYSPGGPPNTTSVRWRSARRATQRSVGKSAAWRAGVRTPADAERPGAVNTEPSKGWRGAQQSGRD